MHQAGDGAVEGTTLLLRKTKSQHAGIAASVLLSLISIAQLAFVAIGFFRKLSCCVLLPHILRIHFSNQSGSKPNDLDYAKLFYRSSVLTHSGGRNTRSRDSNPALTSCKLHAHSYFPYAGGERDAKTRLYLIEISFMSQDSI